MKFKIISIVHYPNGMRWKISKKSLVEDVENLFFEADSKQEGKEVQEVHTLVVIGYLVVIWYFGILGGNLGIGVLWKSFFGLMGGISTQHCFLRVKLIVIAVRKNFMQWPMIREK